MRLLKLELKRVLKTRSTLVLLAVALLLSFVMAWLPSSFTYISYTDADGNTVVGREAREYEKEVQADTAGAVTPEKVRQAVEIYQTCLNKYGVENSYDLPDGVYDTEILPYALLLHGVREAFADPDTGIGPSLMEIDPEEIDSYYDVCEERIVSLMKLEQEKYPAAQEAAVTMYREVEKPFFAYPGYTSDAMDYQMLLAFLIALLCTVIAAPVFTFDYQTGSDDILRCTKYGKTRLAATKMASALLICGITFSLCAVIYILVSNSLFGWECTKNSIQMIFSIVNLADMNIGELQWFNAVSCLLSALAMVSFTLFLSSKFKNVAACTSCALFCFLLPLIVYMALPSSIGHWIYSILPSGGVCLQTGILYAVIDFDFLTIGNTAVWLPHVMLGAYIVEIPLFLILTAYSYSRHKVK